MNSNGKGEYDVNGHTKISVLLRNIPGRLDGMALIVSIVITLLAGLAPLFGFGFGKFKAGAVAYPLLLLIPILFILYCSLIYFSSTSIVSRIFNSIILIAAPIYLVLTISGRV